AAHPQPQSISHRLVHDRKCDRDPKAAIEHLVEIAIARVVVVFAVPAKLLLDKQHPVNLSQDRLDSRPDFESISRANREVLNSLEIRFNLKIGIGVAPDFKGNAGEVDLVSSREEPSKLGTFRKRSSHQSSSSRAIPKGSQNSAESAKGIKFSAWSVHFEDGSILRIRSLLLSEM